MSAEIPEAYKDLLEGPVFVTLVTMFPNGQPQANPVWCSYDGTYVLINSARGRAKDKNMRANPHVTVLAVDPKNPYRWIEVRGKVEEITEEGALDHINTLSKLYRGEPDYYAPNPQSRGKETRVIYKIKPVRVIVRGQPG
jgi:PPOX class probable F420-dependent enzyme